LLIQPQMQMSQPGMARMVDDWHFHLRNNFRCEPQVSLTWNREDRARNQWSHTTSQRSLRHN